MPAGKLIAKAFQYLQFYFLCNAGIENEKTSVQ